MKGLKIILTVFFLLFATFGVSGAEEVLYEEDFSTAVDSNVVSLGFTTGGDADWFVDTASDQVQSGPMSDSELTWLARTVDLSNVDPAYSIELSFDWSADSEELYDLGSFYINDVFIGEIGGLLVPWTTVTVDLSAYVGQTIVLMWEYSKDGTFNSGADAVYLDNILVVGTYLTTGTTPTYSCSGFQAPLANGSVKVKKNRVLPVKAELVDADNFILTDADIVSSPVIQVSYSSSPGYAVDVTDDAYAAGLGTDGNAFEYNVAEQVWQFNLKTKNYTSPGTYTITMQSGDETEYLIDTCEAQ